jgi:HSP20 family protein
MPGFRKEEIDVSLDNGTLEITAERKPEEFKGTTHLSERRYSRVQRRFSLPHAVDESNIEAKFQDGVLHVEMKKTEAAKGRKIAVQ